MRALATLLIACVALSAQLAPPNSAGVSMGLIQLNVSDMAAAKHFWVDILGAAPTQEGVQVPDAIILFNSKAPTGGTVGSVVNHLGLKVQSLSSYPPRLKAAGIPFTVNPNGQQIMIDGPEGVRVELTVDPAMQVPVAHHHIHFYTAQVPEMKAWYAKTFDAVPGMRGKFEAADIPGANLSFTHADPPPAPSKGRVVDRVGFEVKNLQAFCRKLEAQGVKFDSPYNKPKGAAMATAFFTDPWGTSIELTEGLGKH
jgi:catechol 2,3-dioxygenase-like lactoylglutathione lyase family enzyme